MPAFRTDRWDYLGYYKSPRGKLSNRTVTLYFDNNALSRMEGVEALTASDSAAPKTADAAAIYQQQKKEKNEDERAAEQPVGGVILTQPSNNTP